MPATASASATASSIESASRSPSAASSSSVTCGPRPSITASASTRQIRSHDRIASSLPGTTRSTSSGSQFVSTSPISGMFSRRASRTASASAFRSITNTACGRRRRSATPPMLVSSFSSSFRRAMRSLVGSRSSWPSVDCRRRSCRCSMRPDMVRKFVSRPPSQRWLTYGMPARAACDATASRDCFFVPTNSTVPPLGGDVAHLVVRLLEQPHRLLQIDDVDPGALTEDEAAHLGVPPAGLVAEVDASLEQLAHRGRGHGSSLIWFDGSCSRRARAGPDLEPAPSARRISTGVGDEDRRSAAGSDSTSRG